MPAIPYPIGPDISPIFEASVRMYLTNRATGEVVVEGIGAPIAWTGEKVQVELRDIVPPTPGFTATKFEQYTGTLLNVTDFGVALEQPVGSASETLVHRFYPWSAVRHITLA